MLLGDPGSGKTEWLKWLARRKAGETRRQVEDSRVRCGLIPLTGFVRLPQIAAALVDEKVLRGMLVEVGCLNSPWGSLTEAQLAAAAILSVLMRYHKLDQRLAPWAWEHLQGAARTKDVCLGSRPLLCLDAFDEVRMGRERLVSCLRAFAENTPARLFLTSRLLGYSESPLPLDGRRDVSRRELRFCSFGAGESETFVESFFNSDKERGQRMIEELRAKSGVAGMAQNPLLATLLCMAFSPDSKRPPLDLPARRVEIYDRVLRGILGEWGVRPVPEHCSGEMVMAAETLRPYLIAAKLDLLASLAYHFFPHEELGSTAINDFLYHGEDAYMTRLAAEAPLRKYLALRPDATIDKVLCEDAVLLPCGEDSYAFLHYTFQEYLTARYLATRVNRDGWEQATVGVPSHGNVPVRVLIEKCGSDRLWQEMVILFASQLNDPVPLLKSLSDPGCDDPSATRLALSAMCLAEMGSATFRVPPRMVDRIVRLVWNVWTCKIYDACHPSPVVRPQFHAEALLVQMDRRVRETMRKLGGALCALAQSGLGVDGVQILDWFRRALYDFAAAEPRGSSFGIMWPANLLMHAAPDFVRIVFLPRFNRAISTRVGLPRLLALVLHGSATRRKALGMALRDAGCLVVSAERDDDAILLMRSDLVPHILIAGQHLIREDLHDVWEFVRSRPSMASTLLFVLAPWVDKSVVEHYRDAGVNGVLEAPFDVWSIWMLVGLVEMRLPSKLTECCDASGARQSPGEVDQHVRECLKTVQAGIKGEVTITMLDGRTLAMNEFLRGDRAGR